MATSGDQGRAGDDDARPLAHVRESELERAAEILGVARVVLFRYADSGIDTDAGAGAFSETATSEIAARLAAIIREERASALVIYDEGGIYGHPDHVQINRAGHAAAALLGDALPTVYEATVDREYLHFVDTHLIDHARESLPEIEHVGVPTVFVSTMVDVRRFLQQKRAAIAAHTTQVPETSSVMTLSEEAFRNVYGYEWYVRHGPPGVIELLSG
jgi:LmbE family N-acetylglucosaminyl deacetylase